MCIHTCVVQEHCWHTLVNSYSVIISVDAVFVLPVLAVMHSHTSLSAGLLTIDIIPTYWQHQLNVAI